MIDHFNVINRPVYLDRRRACTAVTDPPPPFHAGANPQSVHLSAAAPGTAVLFSERSERDTRASDNAYIHLS